MYYTVMHVYMYKYVHEYMRTHVNMYITDSGVLVGHEQTEYAGLIWHGNDPAYTYTQWQGLAVSYGNTIGWRVARRTHTHVYMYMYKHASIMSYL